MKKLIFTGLAVLITLALIACDDFSPVSSSRGGGSSNALGMTDVAYSPDGTRLTLYLDGGVPETRAARALSKDLALAGHDFYEVVFYNSDGTNVQVARASWEIGESAGIRNVPRGVPGTGINYSATGAAAIAAGSYAVLFVGRKSDRTLLAIGKLSSGSATVNTTTTSVTFEILALDAGLRLPSTLSPIPLATDTFLTAALDDGYLGGGDTDNDGTAYNEVSAAGTQLSTASATVSSVSYSFPAYNLPTNAAVSATYGLGPTATIGDYLLGVRVAATAGAEIKVPPRIPIGGGSYGGLGTPWARDTTAQVVTMTMGNQITNPIPITITTKDEEGVCALTFAVPVYAIYNTNVSGVANALTWYVRPGFGTAAYDLDNGSKGTGGSILLAVGDVTLDYISVLTTW